jgi:putative glutamine amidotransferase
VTPRIAVLGVPVLTGDIANWTSPASAASHRYIDALARAGADAFILPCPTVGQDAESHDKAVAASLRLLDVAHGVLFLGGDDVDPKNYGAAAHVNLGPTHLARDQHELAVAQHVRKRKLPTMGVCRGLQLLNVAFGGTLHQHLPAIDGMQSHADTDPAVPVLHDVEIAPNTKLHSVIGSSVLENCSSVHHQGIDHLGDRLVASAHSADGLIEAIEALDDWWMLAVQWHPERTAPDDKNQQALFDAFVSEVGAHV